ncbi:MAG: TonB-dependent receptor [Longimicrobiales bacterium]
MRNRMDAGLHLCHRVSNLCRGCLRPGGVGGFPGAKVVLILALGIAVAPSVLAGQETGEAPLIIGVVRAQGGEPVPEVEVRFEPGGEVVHTDASGGFRLQPPPGTTGALVFTHPGYMEARIPLKPIEAGQLREMGITLVRIFALDALSVVSRRQRPLLNTDDAETGGTVEPFELELLPADARNPLVLAFNVPGVSQSTGFFGDAPPLVIHGENSLYTRYALDGLDNDEGFLGGPRIVLPLSALERLHVHTAVYRPGLGRSSNGVVEMETRAGGEEWSGDLLLVNRPGTPLDADPRFAPAGVDPDGFRRTQSGGSLGGPLVSGRTFFFGAVEFTAEEEDRIGSTARTAFLGTEERRSWKAFGRLDHGWTFNQTTTLRFALHDVRRKGQGGGVIVPEADITTRRIGTLTSLTHRSAFRDGRASNALSAQLGTFTWDLPPSASDLNTPQVTIVSPDLTTIEAVVGSSNFVFDESELQLQLKEEMEMRLGERHTLRIGADLVRSSFKLLGANTNPRGAYTVVNEANIQPSGSFLSIRDIPSHVRVLRYTIDAHPQQVDLSQTLVGAFVEDRWRITPSLTAQFGLRWDYDDITSRGESDPDLDNFQPRISFNWFATSRSVVRGGWGLYTGKFPYAVYSDAVQFGPDGNAVVTFEEGTGFPPPVFGEGPSAAEIQALEGALPPREVRRMFARGLEQPYSSQLSLGYQRQVGEVWSVSLDGVWMESRNLPRSWDLNALDYALQPGDTVNRSPGFGDAHRPVDPAASGYRRLTTTDSGGKGRYLGLQTSVRRALVDGLAVEGSWVWSRSRNDTEDINFNAATGNDFDAEWADGINDRRHHVTVRGVWEPLDRLSMAGIFDFQTGTPVNRVAHFRDLDGSGPVYGNGFLGNHDRFPGVKRNSERLPDAWTLSGSAAWTPGLAGGVLALRVEGFNLLNRTNYTGFANGIPGGGPRTQVGRPGDPLAFTTAAPPRQFQLSARWVF